MHALRVPLYLKIWLAVVGAVSVLTLLVGWVWHATSELPPREVLVHNDRGELIGHGLARSQRPPPIPTLPEGEVRRNGPEFDVTMNDGQVMHIHMPRVLPQAGQRGFWSRPPFSFLWMQILVAVAVALGIFPIVRRLTKRLEALRSGVERWGSGDLSARVAMEGDDEVGFLAERFNHAAGRIESLLSAHKTLLANASHELRSPLTRIRMGLELMGEHSPSPGQRSEMERSIGELDELIGEILLASRLDAPEANIGTMETVDLTGLVAEECAHHGAALEAKAVSVRGAPKLLRRLVRNLLENARRYSNGAAEVSISVENTQALLRVRDHGPGVPPAQRERIFEPFYRLPGASERDGGVGLGLALVKSITLRHGGTVACEAPAEGEGGACFIIRLPQARPLS